MSTVFDVLEWMAVFCWSDTRDEELAPFHFIRDSFPTPNFKIGLPSPPSTLPSPSYFIHLPSFLNPRCWDKCKWGGGATSSTRWQPFQSTCGVGVAHTLTFIIQTEACHLRVEISLFLEQCLLLLNKYFLFTPVLCFLFLWPLLTNWEITIWPAPLRRK